MFSHFAQNVWLLLSCPFFTWSALFTKDSSLPNNILSPGLLLVWKSFRIFKDVSLFNYQGSLLLVSLFGVPGSDCFCWPSSSSFCFAELSVSVSFASIAYGFLFVNNFFQVFLIFFFQLAKSFKHLFKCF